MKHKLVYTPEAEEDVLEIVKKHAEWVGPNSARNIYQGLRGGLLRLTEFPLMGQVHPDPELAAKDFRKLVLDQTYVAVYRVLERSVVVYRVVNGARDYPALLKR